MKKALFYAVLMGINISLIAQNNYYCVNNERCYWQEDSSSVNIIVSDMSSYDQIVENILELFSDKTDTVSYVEDDDNIIVISDKIKNTSLNQLVSYICKNPSDIAFITYSKRVNGRRIWLRNETYVRLKDETLYTSYLLSYLSQYI